MNRAERVQANLSHTMQFIKDCKVQTIETSLSIIAQCQIDISYTLALMLDEMLERKDKAISLDKVKQAREEIAKVYPKSIFDHDKALRTTLQIIDELISESEEK